MIYVLYIGKVVTHDFKLRFVYILCEYFRFGIFIIDFCPNFIILLAKSGID